MGVLNAIGNKTANLTLRDGGFIQTDTDNGGAFTIKAYDQDGAVYVTVATIQNANSPSLELLFSKIGIINGGYIRTMTDAAGTMALQGYDVDGAAYKTFLTITNGNTPTFDMSDPGGTTMTINGVTIGNVTPRTGGFTQATINNSGGGSLYVAGAGNITATTASANVYVDNSTNHAIHIKATSSGSFGAMYFYNSSDSLQGSITCSGGATAYNVSSDYRLKENVHALKDGISRVKALNPVEFNFIGYDKKLEGFIAHEVQAVVPQAVTGEKDATMKPYRLIKAEKDIHSLEKAEDAHGNTFEFEANAVYYWKDNDVVAYAMQGKNGIFRENLILDNAKKERSSKAKNLLDDILADAVSKGLIDQPVDEVDPQQLDMSHLIPVLVKAVQELSEQVEKLKQK